MTPIERLSRMDELLNNSLVFGYREAAEFAELRKGIKITDFFRWMEHKKEQYRCSPDYLYKYLGATILDRDCRLNPALEAAIKGGYVTRYQQKKFGRYFTYVELTKKGRKLIEDK